ncbi:winged helix-turn-helix domain-containing protein [Xanthobacter sediminis]
MFRFAGFELDEQRAELRGLDGVAIRLRPKTFEMLRLFAAHAGQVLSKRQLMEAVWPDVHVSEDGLFQCIREIRAALGDDQRQIIKLVSGRGYLFSLEVSFEPADPAPSAEAALPTPEAQVEPPAHGEAAAEAPQPRWRLFGLRGPAALAAVAGLCAIVGLAVAAMIFRPDSLFRRTPPIVAVMPITDASEAPEGGAMAAGVTDRLIDGFAKIGNIRVATPQSGPAAASSAPSDFMLQGELRKDPQSWTLRAHIIRTATGEVESVATISVEMGTGDQQLQQTRLAAGAGDPLARRLNEVLEAGAPPAGDAKVVIEQATASINRTTRERFATARTMLETSLADAPDNADLQVALAALQLRGIQMLWYDPAERAAAESGARSLLERAVHAKPRYIPVLEAYCRFLTATDQFPESLVTCAKALSFDPWNGAILYNIGLSQIQLGRFEDALATFELADRFDTPEVSRWTWLLGAGWACLLMGHDEAAVSWLQRSIAITPASGRSYLMLAVAYQRLGRPDEAKAALAKAMELRPGSTAANVQPPTRNSGQAFLDASKQAMRTIVEIGLPER